MRLQDVSPGYEEPNLDKEIMRYSNQTRLFFNDDFTELVDYILENTFFNLIQEATHGELDLVRMSKKYVNVTQKNR